MECKQLIISLGNRESDRPLVSLVDRTTRGDQAMFPGMHAFKRSRMLSTYIRGLGKKEICCQLGLRLHWQVCQISDSHLTVRIGKRNVIMRPLFCSACLSLLLFLRLSRW